jgi:hypothetical protein
MDPAAGGRHRSVEVAGAHGTIASNPAAVREVALYLAEAEAQPEG